MFSIIHLFIPSSQLAYLQTKRLFGLNVVLITYNIFRQTTEKTDDEFYCSHS